MPERRSQCHCLTLRRCISIISSRESGVILALHNPLAVRRYPGWARCVSSLPLFLWENIMVGETIRWSKTKGAAACWIRDCDPGKISSIQRKRSVYERQATLPEAKVAERKFMLHHAGISEIYTRRGSIPHLSSCRPREKLVFRYITCRHVPSCSVLSSSSFIVLLPPRPSFSRRTSLARQRGG